MNYLLVMLRSGVALNDAIKVLLSIPFYYQKGALVQRDLQAGRPISQAFSHFFPWWCPYPFYHVAIAIDTISFLEACQKYLNFRRDWIRMAVVHLMYPLVLFLFSMVLIMMIIQSIGFSMLVQWKIALYACFFLLCCLGGLVFYCLGCRLLLISSLDVLEICRLSLMQGWSMGSLFDSLSFPSGPLKKWRKVAKDAILLQSFIQAFSCHFFLPIVIIESLKMHERTGGLLSGLQLTMPLFREISMTRFCFQCQCLKAMLYGWVVFFILGIVFLIYFPMMNQYLR